MIATSVNGTLVPDQVQDERGTRVAVPAVVGAPQLAEMGQLVPASPQRKHEAPWSTMQDRPAEVYVWQATNPKARDFRLDVIGPAYTRSALKESAKGVYEARVPKPAAGYTAFFVELVYPSGGKYPFKFTTEVSVVPDVLPFRWENAKASVGR